MLVTFLCKYYEIDYDEYVFVIYKSRTMVTLSFNCAASRYCSSFDPSKQCKNIWIEDIVI